MTTAGSEPVAALGWLTARLGQPNPIADLADQLGIISIPVVIVLWITTLVIGGRHRAPQLQHPTIDEPAAAR